MKWPPIMLNELRWEATTPAALRAELDATPLHDDDRSWREWELALAERQAVIYPGLPFCRVVNV